MGKYWGFEALLKFRTKHISKSNFWKHHLPTNVRWFGCVFLHSNELNTSLKYTKLHCITPHNRQQRFLLQPLQRQLLLLLLLFLLLPILLLPLLLLLLLLLLLPPTLHWTNFHCVTRHDSPLHYAVTTATQLQNTTPMHSTKWNERRHSNAPKPANLQYASLHHTEWCYTTHRKNMTSKRIDN